ncbi:DUF3024 domain-containing protein [Reinekea marinisedimentorum]|uniref:DUF3024 family protein n=1 Tax=Reinekea marinisedimentorum TaxID=230495 RepID=A0A4R3HT83_9GAMM|nr:DUF3024 domain-containing protein [Reinekea marinisedimentorum]TCS35904.1 Protein of unknown function (DUF3024) [Reinekea marinisedimentorum]
MPLSEFEIKKYEKAKAAFMAKRRPRPEIRSKLDLDCRLEERTMQLFEVRPQWDDPSVQQEISIAKAKYDSSEMHWKIYWMDSKQQWREYGPDKRATTIEEVFNIIDIDETGAFFG